MNGKQLTAFLLAVSLFGLAVVVASAFYPAQTSENFAMRKPLIGFAFVLLTLAGIAAVFSPDRCSRLVSLKAKMAVDRKQVRKIAEKAKNDFRGHHPNCGKFSVHVIRVGGRTFCAGCTGLFIGGLLGLTGALAYFFTSLKLENWAGLFVAVGALAILFGLFLPTVTKIPFGSIRFLANVTFPLGSFLILMGADSLAQSTSLDVFLLILIFFWLLTKITISRSGHKQICRLCKDKNCESRGF